MKILITLMLWKYDQNGFVLGKYFASIFGTVSYNYRHKQYKKPLASMLCLRFFFDNRPELSDYYRRFRFVTSRMRTQRTQTNAKSVLLICRLFVRTMFS